MDTYLYLKQIMDEREANANKVKEELVKQEDMKIEKETKRIKQKQH